MGVTIAEVYAKNEYSASAVTTQSAFMLNAGEEIVRKFQLPQTGWRQLRLLLKVALYSDPLPTSNLTSTRLAIGLCSESRSLGNTGNEHAVGFYLGNDSFSTGTWHLNGNQSFGSGSYSSDWTVPAEVAWMASPYVMRGYSYITGSKDHSTSGYGSYVPGPSFYNTEFSSEVSASNLKGYSWDTMCLTLTKNRQSNGTDIVTMYVDIPRFGFMSYPSGGTNTIAFRGVNVPRSVCRTSIQSDPQQISGEFPYVRWSSWYGNTTPESTYLPLIGSMGNIILPLNEDLFGLLNCVNIKWDTASSVKLLVRDVTVALLAESGPVPATPLTLSVTAASPSSSVLTWS